MSQLVQVIREDGWSQALSRALISLFYRFRDSFTARKLRAPGFRIGGSPRIRGLSHMQIGYNFSAGDHLWLEAVTQYRGKVYEPKLIMGTNINVSDSVHIACLRHVQIGDGLLAGSHVLISDHTHGIYSDHVDHTAHSAPESIPAERSLHSNNVVVIGRNVWLGDGVNVLAGASIGDGSIIGANSIVLGEIPPASIAVGAPAKVIRRWDETQRRWIKLRSKCTAALDKLNS